MANQKEQLGWRIDALLRSGEPDILTWRFLCDRAWEIAEAAEDDAFRERKELLRDLEGYQEAALGEACEWAKRQHDLEAQFQHAPRWRRLFTGYFLRRKLKRLAQQESHLKHEAELCAAEADQLRRTPSFPPQVAAWRRRAEELTARL